jgi:hypothetical protein
VHRALGALLIVVLSFATALALFYGSNMWSTSPFGSFSEPQEDKTDQIVKLEVAISESGEWRNIDTDSPFYASTVTYNVSNYGTTTANDIEVSIFLDGATLEEFSLTSLSSNGSFSDQFSVSANYDTTKEVSITVSCKDSTDTDSLIIYAILTRTFDKNLARLYVTPRDPIIKRTLDTIVKNPLIPDWIEIRDWVANKIQYLSDTESHGVSGYWQLPVETLSLGTGDCEDFSVLLCSLYRATGWDENEVYVVVGQKDGALHAWVKLNVDMIGWQNIEPQAGGLSTIIGDYLSFSGYTAKYNFNDLQFKTLSEDAEV